MGHLPRWFLRVLLPIALAVALLAATAAFFYPFSERRQALSASLARVSGAFSFYALGQKPRFYALLGEKNGKEFRVTARDAFEVTYRDEFVITDVVSDSLFGKGISVDIEGMGKPAGLRVLLRGIDLVDRAVGAKGANPEACRILVKYRGEAIATLPLQVTITAQDWLRYAKNAQGTQDQITYLKRAVAMYRNDTGVRKVLAQLYTRAGMPREAAALYEEILALKPNDPAALAELAKHHMGDRAYDRAIDLWQRVLQANPQDTRALAGLAGAYGAKGLWKEEVAYYERILALEPQNGVAYYNMGLALEKGRRDQDASRAYRKVLELKKGDVDATERLGHLAFKEKRYAEAVHAYEAILKASPRQGSLHANLGFAYGELKDYKASAEHYEKAIKSGIKDPRLKQNLAYARAKLGRPPADKGAPAAAPASAANTEADRYVRQKKYDKAIQVYRRLIAREPKKASNYDALGRIYGLKGETAREIESYQKALRYGKGSDDLYGRLGGAYERKGMLPEALKAYTKAYELNPEAGEAARKIPQLKIRMLQEKYDAS